MKDQKIEQYQFKEPYQRIANLPEKRDFASVLRGLNDIRTYCEKQENRGRWRIIQELDVKKPSEVTYSPIDPSEEWEGPMVQYE